MPLLFPASFRKMPPEEKQKFIFNSLHYSPESVRSSTDPAELLNLCDVMVENAFGFLPIPLGIAPGFVIDGKAYNIPMATEEPSVIAAASYAALIIGQSGGFTTSATDPVMAVQIFLEKTDSDGENALLRQTDLIKEHIIRLLPSITARGGGLRDLEITRLTETQLVRVQIWIDVRDAMGANLLNTLGEEIRPVLERISGGHGFISILSNDGFRRRAQASFRIPVSRLSRAELSGQDVGEKIVLASLLAQEDPGRAVTHNKGVMNGITALALATGNDTRALEAAVHQEASRDGQYRGITRFDVADGFLHGFINIPLPLATVGGATGFHPVFRLCHDLLDNPDAQKLSRIAAALGLAQNFAALWALVSEGIQKGHMKLHARKLAYQLGARGIELNELSNRIFSHEAFSLEKAKTLLEKKETSSESN